MRALYVLAMLLLACDPAEGDRCEPGAGRCTTSGEALLCLGGTLTRTPCRGPDGCRTEGERALCDRSVGAPGDPCAGGEACDAAGRAFLVCREGALVVGSQCSGGCFVEGERVRCLGPELEPPLR